MKTPRFILLALATLVPFLMASGPDRPTFGGGGTFVAFDVMVDSSTPLAAYQVDIQVAKGVTIVGIEGGESAAFNAAPAYDPEAMEQERVILASFSLNTAANLPTGNTRIARIHVVGSPNMSLPTISLSVAADSAGNKLNAAASIAPSKELEQ